MFIDSSMNSPKLQLTSEPWSDDDYSFKNRAQLSPYTDELNAGFSVFLNHPSEVGKKIKGKNGDMVNISNYPLQARMDRVRFILLMNSIIRLCKEKDYKGRTIKLKNFWYGQNGDVILTDGKKKPVHVATIRTHRDDDGVICIGVKEMKHPERDQRPGATFKIDSGMWFDVCDNETDSKLSKPEDSKENALAFVENWKGTMLATLDKNYAEFIKKKLERKAAGGYGNKNANAGNNTQSTSSSGANWS